MDFIVQADQTKGENERKFKVRGLCYRTENAVDRDSDTNHS